MSWDCDGECMIIIDGRDTILGRLASYVAKKALEGGEIKIINAEYVVISGNKDNIVSEYRERIEKGDRYKGPFYPRMPDRIVRRAIRGMLPYKKGKGKEAFKRVMVYIGVPDDLKDKEFVKLEGMLKDNLKDMKYLYLKDLSKYLGAKI